MHGISAKMLPSAIGALDIKPVRDAAAQAKNLEGGVSNLVGIIPPPPCLVEIGLTNMPKNGEGA